jgi:hypothetical protein
LDLKQTICAITTDWRERNWESPSRPATIAWLAFYLLFLLYAFRGSGDFLLIDNVNLIVHEAGHLLFGWFGEILGIAGGTLLQLMLPAALTASFAYRKHTAGTAFCCFFLFENFLYIATYMADARALDLPLVSVGGGETIDHDWALMLGELGLLERDTQIAGLVRIIGWLGMLATVAWLGWRAWRDQDAARVQAASA